MAECRYFFFLPSKSQSELRLLISIFETICLSLLPSNSTTTEMLSQQSNCHFHYTDDPPKWPPWCLYPVPYREEPLGQLCSVWAESPEHVNRPLICCQNNLVIWSWPFLNLTNKNNALVIRVSSYFSLSVCYDLLTVSTLLCFFPFFSSSCSLVWGLRSHLKGRDSRFVLEGESLGWTHGGVSSVSAVFLLCFCCVPDLWNTCLQRHSRQTYTD